MLMEKCKKEMCSCYMIIIYVHMCIGLSLHRTNRENMKITVSLCYVYSLCSICTAYMSIVMYRYT